MKLLTAPIRSKLLANSKKEPVANGFKPVVKFFRGACTWLITDMDEDGMMFGLCDLGMGSPELGYVSLEEMEDFNNNHPFGIERDMNFVANKTVSEYASAAREKGSIIA